MAKVNESASRQTTRATPEPTPAKSARATRGQSREPQQTQRRSARNARSASVENDAEHASAMKNATETDLTTVTEDALIEDNEDNNIDSNMDHLENVQSGHANNGSSPGRVSAISGMTGKTTFSTEEIEELDTDVMLDSLKNLEAASEELLKTLVPAFPVGVDALFAPLSEIATLGTKASKLYQKRLDAFMLYKSDYTAAGQEYIRPQNVSRALFEVSSIDSIPEGTKRPDSVLYKANLAYMLHLLLIRMRDSDASSLNITEALEGANQAFPTVVAGREYNHSAVTLSIALTTQLAINRIASFVEDPNFNPQGIATHAFFSEDDEGNVIYRHHNALHLDSLTEEQAQPILDRINGIVSALKEPFDDSSEQDPVEAVESLRTTWNWVGFVEKQLVPHFVARKLVLDEEVLLAGGIEELDLEIKRAVQNKDDFKNVAAMTARLEESRQALNKSRQSKSLAAGGIRELRAMTQAAPLPQGVAPTARMTAPQPEDNNHQADDYLQINQDEPATAPTPASSNLHDLSMFQDMSRNAPASAGPSGKGKGRGKGKAKAKFNERQPGAHRVEWDESQHNPDLVHYMSPAGRLPAPQSSVLGKRSRDVEEQWDPTQDGGPQDDEDDAFQLHRVNDAAAHMRRMNAPNAIQSARASLSQPMHLRPEFDGTEEPSPKRRNPGSTIPGPAEYPGSAYQVSTQRPHPNPNIAPASTPFAQEYQQAAWAARQYRILNNSTPARERRVWNDLETEALMTYINEWPEEDNLHYAAMKRKDSTDEGLKALDGRTAEDIRFRARNMKVNFLLSRSQDLHPNWAKVQLAKKEIDKLHARGVPYAQIGLRGALAAGPVAEQVGERNE